MYDDGRVDRMCQQVADRDVIDWQTMESESFSVDDLAQLELLELLDSIALAHSTFQSEPMLSVGGDGPSGFLAPPLPDDDLLRSWGRYRLDEKLGRGGFGSVYRGWDPDLEMPVAIKILHRGVGDEQLHARLLREGRVLAQIKHPNVVRVLTVEQNEGRLGLVMEFLRGQTLDAMIAAHGALNDREATVIAEDVCRALAAVHANKLIHRDVKARNILREQAGRIVLMDFGAGLAVDARLHEPAVGTPLYMAPEVLRNEAASVASDIYGLGVLLFFLTTRRHPYEGATVDDIREAHATGRRQSLLELRPDLPLPFVHVVDRALAPDPRARYASATALLQALTHARDAAPRWRAWLVRAAVGVPALGVILTLGGMLSSLAFNQTLGRGEYANESIGDWFGIGRRSLFLPFVLASLAVAFIALSAAARNLLVTMSTRMRALDRVLAERCGALARRLSLNDLAICSYWLVLVTALGATAAGVYWAPLLRAVGAYAATAPAEVLAVLSPAPRLEWFQVIFRMTLSLLAAANLGAWYALVRGARARGARLPPWLTWAEIVTLVLLYGMLQLPYRLINDSDEFTVVQWGAERCHVLGERASTTLLFCPQMNPRTRIVRTSEPLVPLHVSESLFSSFAPRVP